MNLEKSAVFFRILLVFFINIAYQLFNQVVESSDTGHFAIFIKKNCKVIPGLLHVIKKLCCFHAFRNEISRLYGFCQNVFSGAFIQTEIGFGIQDTDDIFFGFLTDRIVAVAILINDIFPFIKRILCVQDNYIRTVCADLFRSNINENQKYSG